MSQVSMQPGVHGPCRAAGCSCGAVHFSTTNPVSLLRNGSALKNVMGEGKQDQGRRTKDVLGFFSNYIAKSSPGNNFSFVSIPRTNSEKLLQQLKRFISSLMAGTLSAHTFRLTALLLGGERGDHGEVVGSKAQMDLSFPVQPEALLGSGPPQNLQSMRPAWSFIHSFALLF